MAGNNLTPHKGYKCPINSFLKNRLAERSVDSGKTICKALKGMHFHRLWVLVVFIGLLPSAVYAAKNVAVVPGNKVSTAANELKKLLKEPFTFAVNGSDPFMPFISDQMIKEQVDKEVKSLTGMQLFEPGQLNLVAILFSGKKALAMVQDSTGKGYIIKKGTKIGRRGQVAEIIPNAVVVKEWFRDSSGKKLYKDNEMVLRKEGGNK